MERGKIFEKVIFFAETAYYADVINKARRALAYYARLIDNVMEGYSHDMRG